MSPNHSKIYDEYSDGASQYNFTIPTKIEAYLLGIFNNGPHSVIMSGNAGDGKTKLSRVVHDHFTGSFLDNWPTEGIIEVPFSNGRIRIVKDLSELKENVILQELTHLQSYIENNHYEKIYYLIAANEGKLTKFLSQYESLKSLSKWVADRFLSNDKNDNSLTLINLQDVTSSTYVERILEEWNQEENWETCLECSKNRQCIIFLNHNHTSKKEVHKRLVEQYRILDYSGVHITMRELLIHLSYTITGGLACEEIFKADFKEIEHQANKAYYENFYGHSIPSEAMNEMGALQNLKPLDPGNFSHSLIDDFILNGDISGDEELEADHSQLFNNELDMLFGYFKKQLEIYRSHDANIDNSLVEVWMPRLRRKYFFETLSNNEKLRLHLVPFDYYREFNMLFNNKALQSSIKKELISGLNRAFSKKLVANSGTAQLFATTENLLIHQTFLHNHITLTSERQREDIDHLPSKFKISVSNQAYIEMGLTLFEYLMRLANGGMFTTLKQEVEILINTFKNDLIKISVRDEYTLSVLKLNTNEGTYSNYEITICDNE
ncbi:hypothetical protein [Paenibacillus planticolens]|uniref:Uncharacterized protein n=1 Tax=Paenibacillus planticolens TaxID=2654976 RepID=A0ABX1ZHH6_9BACL|nr:hypothetical protein [Paenibacillus planticolens]NOU99528.1 hypothetical protein [Paenibacillus planticolens]